MQIFSLFRAMIKIQIALKQKKYLIQDFYFVLFASAPAAVIITEIEEVLDDDSHKTGKLRINWNKTEGGDEIDGFLVKCQSNSYEVEETVSYVPGQSHYEHITRKLFQGEVVNVTVSARNSAGNTSTEPQMFDICKILKRFPIFV